MRSEGMDIKALSGLVGIILIIVGIILPLSDVALGAVSGTGYYAVVGGEIVEPSPAKVDSLDKAGLLLVILGVIMVSVSVLLYYRLGRKA